jgi:DNA processing protein
VLFLSTQIMQFTQYNSQNPQFPDKLLELAQVPEQIFVRGTLPTGPAIAVIGSRTPSTYGRRITLQLAGELAAAGITIISGLALGIDALAHQAAVENDRPTVAVLAGGLDKVYPASNYGLAMKILDGGGALVSEYEAGTPSYKQNFIARNRIVAGLADAVLVTEAKASSGALITANFALEQGRIVMAVPGNITSLTSAGPNNLIRSGAVPVTSASDILEALGYRPDAVIKSSAKADSAESVGSRRHSSLILLLSWRSPEKYAI